MFHLVIKVPTLNLIDTRRIQKVDTKANFKSSYLIMNLYSKTIILGLIFLYSVPSIESANILGIFHVQSRSHHSINQPIVRGLAAKGHNVTIISHFKSKDSIPNYTEILLPKPIENFVDSMSIDETTVHAGLVNSTIFGKKFEISSCDDVFSLDYVDRLINSKCKCGKIDLIIAEGYHIHCYHLLSYKLDVPLILISATGLFFGVDHSIGNPYNPSITPLQVSTYTTKMNFFQRLVNAFKYTALYFYKNYYYYEDMAPYAHNVLNMELPTKEELHKKNALVFYNNHLSFISRPKCPNVIDIGGIHIEKSKKLPKDIEEFIEGSPHGIILFSFGSTIKASSIHSEKMKVFKDVFSSIPQRVLWRVDELNMTDIPSNVKLSTWLPQRDILEHKNVIAFISHCGMFGTLEAIHTATPVIGIPFMFDQFQNTNILVEKGVAVYVDYHTMDKNIFLKALNEVITNSKYHENMQKLSKIFNDRPMPALDGALYWTEYVLKHQGAPHLRTPAADMPLYQYLLLDVILFLMGIITGTAYISTYLLKTIIFVLFHFKNKNNNTD